MHDLEFMIVNSALPHSVEDAHELESRVTFSVYQDTQQKGVWDAMGGGKDDVFVYDRCGRLAYYIPFPLSIMNSDEALVVSAILATYYRSPCGLTCDKNDNSSLEDILNSNFDLNNEITNSTTETILEHGNYTNINETMIDEDSESYINSSDATLSDDFDYTLFNFTSNDVSNETEFSTRNQSSNSLDDLIFGLDSSIDSVNNTESVNSTSDETFNAKNDSYVVENNNYNETNINTTTTTQKTPIEIPRKTKSGRCNEGEMLECDNWSKRKLYKARTCCSISESIRTKSQRVMCKNYGRKRCKKLQTVFKCCIKTAWSKLNPTNMFTSAATEEATPAITTTSASHVQHAHHAHQHAQAENTYDVICCRDDENGRMCRVSRAITCPEGEFMVENAAPAILAATGEIA